MTTLDPTLLGPTPELKIMSRQIINSPIKHGTFSPPPKLPCSLTGTAAVSGECERLSSEYAHRKHADNDLQNDGLL